MPAAAEDSGDTLIEGAGRPAHANSQLMHLRGFRDPNILGDAQDIAG